MHDKSLLLGALIASFAASLCCILPIAVAVLGVGSAGAAATFAPFRLPLSVVTLALLGVAFYFNYRPENENCQPGRACTVPPKRRRARILLWIITFLAAAFLAFPYYSRFFI